MLFLNELEEVRLFDFDRSLKRERERERERERYVCRLTLLGTIMVVERIERNREGGLVGYHFSRGKRSLDYFGKRGREKEGERENERVS